MSMDSDQLRHISLQLGKQEALLREGLYVALAKAVDDCGIETRCCRVLDAGVGRGELLQRLQMRGYVTHGIDMELDCVVTASRFGDCRQGGIGDIARVFPGIGFDVIVCSHVLEHVDSPSFALKSFAELSAKAYVFAVPNPLRPIRVMRALFHSRAADHPEHVYAWGHAEFSALLQRCGFAIDAWYADRVTINPLHGRLGHILTRLLNPLETRLLPRLFPMLASSLIVRCHLAYRDLKA
ncbi:methyltransferase family protein [Sulfuritortus calidifontis]|uniref:Methyltransferase family protein n=1 Tax=Sulfuritortus calidifontis TaxID=1914471 RepID=A0A4R3JX91_9PROT|nr:methyltransferase domain-containing protein [Sulfuritortus calidifontis]TCS71936.1 methyltransferase family protein [Sulfuritortus calidifontis]